MKNLALCLFAGLLTVPITAFGYGYPAAMGQGSSMPGIDAVSHGFGGISSVNVGGMNLFANPAELTSYNPSFSTSLGPLILKQSVDDGLGKHNLTYAGLGASSFQTGLNFSSASIALGIAKVRDYTYKGEYFFIETNPDPMISGFENLVVSGSVWEAATGVATVLPGDISIGVTAGYRMGDINYQYQWHHFNESIPDSTSDWSREEGELSWRAGASVPTGENISIGAVYSSETENCPSIIAAGIRFGDVSSFFPGFGLEARVHDTDEKMAWTANFFGGIHPDHNLYFRGGLILSSDGGIESNTSLGLAIGATVDLGKTNISGAFNYGNESREGNVFGFPDVRTVDDIVTAFTIGATIEL